MPPRTTQKGAVAQNRHILLVEDNDHARDKLKALLEAAGYSVASAANGREALDRLRAGALPFVILLDLGMVGMDGWTFHDVLRTDAALAAIPVVLLSAEEDLAEIAGALGVARWLRKPVELDVLLQVVKQSL